FFVVGPPGYEDLAAQRTILTLDLGAAELPGWRFPAWIERGGQVIQTPFAQGLAEAFELLLIGEARGHHDHAHGLHRFGQASMSIPVEFVHIDVLDLLDRAARSRPVLGHPAGTFGSGHPR